jgi:hypothetical protein
MNSAMHQLGDEKIFNHPFIFFCYLLKNQTYKSGGHGVCLFFFLFWGEFLGPPSFSVVAKFGIGAFFFLSNW